MPEKVLVGVSELKKILQIIVPITRKELQNQTLPSQRKNMILLLIMAAQYTPYYHLLR